MKQLPELAYPTATKTTTTTTSSSSATTGIPLPIVKLEFPCYPLDVECPKCQLHSKTREGISHFKENSQLVADLESRAKGPACIECNRLDVELGGHFSLVSKVFIHHRLTHRMQPVW
ncbi:hypothetical protein Pelo_2950 [Pelomyxa schiedti]|nr:hypothetical protein Pelo_2950 [Pelomyxa schiedti]